MGRFTGRTTTWVHGRSPRTIVKTLVLLLLAAALVGCAAQSGTGAGVASAAPSPSAAQTVAKPAKPIAESPSCTIAVAKPAFTWGKAARAKKYEVRVYRGSDLLLKKTGVTDLSWKSDKALPEDVGLSWKVRGKNVAGNGPWSKRLTFDISTSGGGG